MTINEKGIILDSFEDIFNNLAEGMKKIYGEDINLDPNSPDGQMLGIFSKVVYDLESFLGRVYNSLDPDLAEGHELDKILKLLATSRLPATKSIVDVEIEVSKNTILPADYTLKDINNQEWVIEKEQEVLEGVNIVTFVAKDWGRIEALPNTITKQVTIIPEVISVTNPNAALPGRDEESDVELRKRRNKIIGYNAVSLISGMLGKILMLEEVKDAVIYENDTDLYDNVKDLPPHTIWVIVEGGDVNDIAKIIATDKTLGTGMKGDIEVNYIEQIPRKDGTFREYVHTIKFDRPAYSDVYVKFNVKKKSSDDIIDIEAIKDKLVEFETKIAESINVTELYGYIYSAGNNFIAMDLMVSRDGVNWVDDVLEANLNEKLVINRDYITITEVV